MQLHRFETRKFKLLFQLNCAESSIGTPLMCAVWTNTEKEADGKYGITTDQSQSTLLCIFTCFTRKQYKVTSRQKQSFGNMIKAMNIRCGHAVQSVQCVNIHRMPPRGILHVYQTINYSSLALMSTRSIDLALDKLRTTTKFFGC